MDERTLTALRGSIAKWRDIVDGTTYDGMAGNCDLCKAFASPGRCTGCPVAEASGESGCAETPWEKWDDLFLGENMEERIANTPERVAAAESELDFLISLLPEGEAP